MSTIHPFFPLRLPDRFRPKDTFIWRMKSVRNLPARALRLCLRTRRPFISRRACRVAGHCNCRFNELPTVNLQLLPNSTAKHRHKVRFCPLPAEISYVTKTYDYSRSIDLPLKTTPGTANFRTVHLASPVST